ncbi:MAG: hypothetical protein IKG01_00960 [Lachnospiraceae bacterium]|nr:hypothetical protein [Lachnospiraceae bacterium]
MAPAQHSLEHLDYLNHVMSEIYRVCKEGALFYIGAIQSSIGKSGKYTP